MDDESTRLTAEERRIFEEIETALRADRRPSFRERLRRASGWKRGVATTAVFVGTALIAGGLWFGPVVVAAVGYVTVVVGLSGLVPAGAVGRVMGRARRRLGHDATPGASP
jgi:hypothetical protein